MNFLFPAMFAGLASLALPVILHLIARQKFPVMDFPSIRLLQGENRTNTLAPRLVDIVQLLLRLLVLLLLVLAMSRLFTPSLSSFPAARNTIIVIDGSASMMQLVDNPDGLGKITIFELAKRRATAIANDVNAPSRVSVIVAGGASSTIAPLEPGHEHAVISVDGFFVTLNGAASTLGALMPGVDVSLQLGGDGTVKGIVAWSHEDRRSGVSGALVRVDRAAREITVQPNPGPLKTYTLGSGVKPYDACGSGLVEAVASACDMLGGRREVGSQIIVLTNLRKSAFEFRGQRDLQRILDTRQAQGSRLQIVFVDLAPAATENLGISNAYVRGRKVMAGADAHVISTIVNTGSQEQKTKVTLSVGNPDTVSKIVKIAAGSRAIVDLTSPVNRAMRTFAKVSIDEDSFPADDTFNVPLPVVDSRRVLIVNGQSQGGASTGGGGGGAMEGLGSTDAKKTSHEPEIDGATILKFVLNPGRELGGTSNSGIDPVMVSPEAVAVQPLSKYEIVVLYDVSSLPEQVMNDLATFVSEGRSLLIICSGKTNAVQFNRSIAASGKDHPALAPVELESNEVDSKTPLEISLKDNPHPILTAFTDPRHGDLSVIRFDKLRRPRLVAGDATHPEPRLPEGALITLATPAGHPLAIERPLGRGKVMMFTFGFELDRGNIARTRVFPPFMWRVVDYLTGQLRTLPPDQLVARTSGALDVSETNFALTSDLQLRRMDAVSSPATPPATAPVDAGRSIVLTASADHTVMIDGLAPGRYVLEKARTADEKGMVMTYGRNVTVQSDPRAGDMTRISPDDVARLFPPQRKFDESVNVVSTDAVWSNWWKRYTDPPFKVVAEFPTNIQQPGGEFWKIFVVALLLAYTVEAIAGFLATARREKERAPNMEVAA